MESHRKLAAIMFTDIVGYTSLMGQDFDKAMHLVSAGKEIQKPLVEKHKGIWLKEMGDGLLVQFASAIDAVNCAIEIQEGARSKFDGKLRIGVHLGDITIVGKDVYGDGVNVASRLESMADPGGIYISDAVLKAMQGQRNVKVKYLGELNLKNVSYSLRTYAIQEPGLPSPDQFVSESPAGSKVFQNFPQWGFFGAILLILMTGIILFTRFFHKEVNGLSDEIGTSIAVLPFKNFSGEPELEPFCDGMTDAIITRLAKLEGINKVISRTTMMRFKESDLSIPEIAEELGVFYILESSFQKFGDQIKITLQLIDGPADNQFWAKEVPGSWGDIFEIQARVAENVAKNIGAQISQSEIDELSREPTSNTLAYELYLKATWNSNYEVDESIKLLEKAIQVDPSFADAYALLGFLKSQFWWFGDSKMANSQEAFDTGMYYYEKALELDPKNPTALYRSISSLILYRWDFEEAERRRHILRKVAPEVTNIAHLIPLGKFEEALAELETRLKSDPLSVGWDQKLLCYYFNNMWDKCLQLVKSAPKGQSSHLDMDITRIYLYFEMYNEALKILDQFALSHPSLKNKPRPLGFLAITYYHLGREPEVLEILRRLKSESMISSGGSPSFFISMIYAQMGEIDAAFQWLSKAYETHEVEMYWLKVEPLFSPMHDDSRWPKMLEKMGFPDLMAED